MVPPLAGWAFASCATAVYVTGIVLTGTWSVRGVREIMLTVLISPIKLTAVAVCCVLQRQSRYKINNKMFSNKIHLYNRWLTHSIAITINNSYVIVLVCL